MKVRSCPKEETTQRIERIIMAASIFRVIFFEGMRGEVGEVEEVT